MTENKRYIVDVTEVLDTCFGYMDNKAPDEREIREMDYLLIGVARSQYDGEMICKTLNTLHEENERLKQELQKIYDIATLKKARDIVDKVYDDLLYETSEESDYARNKVLECLEKLDEFGDDLE